MVSTVTPPPPKSIFVTVGSTKFDALIERILQEDTLKTIRDAGFSRLVVQCGDSVLSLDWTLSGTTLERNVEGLSVELWRFEPSIDARMASADVIISHAGSGSILAALRLKKILIVVPNNTLMDDHQTELADALSERGHLIATSLSSLCDAIASSSSKELVPFPDFDGTRFAKIIDEVMGIEEDEADKS